MAVVPCHSRLVSAREISPERLMKLRGKRSREVIAHELRGRGHGTDAKAIWRWEKGHNQPSARVLPDYATVLGCSSVEELYGEDEDEEAARPMGQMSILEALYEQLTIALGKERV